MASAEIRTYRASLDAVFAAGQRAVRDLGYKIDAIDRTNGLLNFKTGISWSSWAGQEMSAMFVDNSDGTIEVSVTGRRSQSGVVLQVYDWGEAKKIATKLLAEIDRLVKSATPTPPKVQPTMHPVLTADRDERECPFCAELILSKAKVCKHCGRDVVESELPMQPVPHPVKGSVETSSASCGSTVPIPSQHDVRLICECGAR